MQALEATKMVLDLSSYKRVDIELLDRALTKLEDLERGSNCNLPSSDVGDNNDNYEELNPEKSLDEPPNSGAIDAEPREIEFLLDMLGNILQQVSVISCLLSPVLIVLFCFFYHYLNS